MEGEFRNEDEVCWLKLLKKNVLFLHTQAIFLCVYVNKPESL